ncbi:hypothetical protein LUCX_3 [Xanthomonas phage vB_XciM_LucasX]|nr:hypothetical protein LUCX_3 [Xanthomonas phage vB_XciM_LucasX]
MAKQKLGDLDWDRSLDYEFDDPFGPTSETKKRGVIQRVATNFAQGALSGLKTPSTMRSIASNSLPKGYGTAINTATEIYRQGQELHNIAMKELEPSLPIMRRLTQRNLPKAKKFLPRSVAQRLEEFSKHTEHSENYSQGQQDAEEIKRSLGEVFGVQMENDARQNAENRVERQLQHLESQHNARNQLKALNVMQQGIMRLVNYQDEVTNKFQRRSLELQTRQYFLTRDQLRLQVDSARMLKASLDALVTNTAMPDIAKQDLRHSASASFRQRMLGSMQDSAGKFASNYFGRMTDRLKSQVRELAGGANDALGMSEMGQDIPMMELLAQMAGSGAVNLGADFLGPKAAKWLTQRSPRMAQLGGFLHRTTDMTKSLPLHLSRYARTPTKREGFLGMGEELLKSLFASYQMNTTVGRGGLDDEDKPVSWDKQSRRTLVEIIPGFLSRMENHLARIHDPAAMRQVYNTDRREFTDIKTASGDMANKILGKDRRANVRYQVEQFIDELIGKTPISEKTRKGLFRQLLLDSGNGEPFDPSRYTSPGSVTPELDAQAKMELATIFSKVGRRKDGKADQVWLSERSDSYNTLDFGSVAPISAAGAYRSAGYRDLLADQGLLTRDGLKDNLNLSRVLDMIQDADYGDLKQQKKLSPAERAKISAATATMGKLRGKEAAALDLFIPGGAKPVLEGAKLFGGAYVDELTGRAIKEWKDIKAGVIDLTTGEPVVSVDQLKNGLVDRSGKAYTFNVDAAIRARSNSSTAGTPNWAQDAFNPTAARSANVTRLRTAAPVRQDDPLDQPEPAPSAPIQAQSWFEAQPAFKMDDAELLRVGNEQLDMLKVIAGLIEAQGPNAGAGEGGGTFRRGFLDTLAIGGAKGAWAALKGVGKAQWWWTKKVAGGMAGSVGAAASGVGAVVQGGSHRLGNLVRGIKDIYVQGERRPIMIAQRIKMGHYQDVNTKKKITRWNDVTGPVIDLTTGETILDQEDFEKGLFVKGPAGLVRLATKSLLGFGSAVAGFYGQVLALPYKVASAGLKAVTTTMKWAFNKQVDVYVKGESSPRLKAEKMKLGRYYNVNPKKMGKVVSTYDDIYGEIKELGKGAHKAQADDKTVLYEDEISNPGLTGRWGLPLATPAARLIGAVGGAAVSVIKGAGALFGGALKGYGKLFGGMMGLGGGLLGAPFKFLGSLLNPFEKHGAKQVEWLERIFNVLDTRLPGKKARKGSWQDQFDKRDAEAKDEATQKQEAERERKWGVGGLLSFFKNKAKGLFGFGGDEEEDEDDDDGGDTTVIMGGGDDGKDKDGKKKVGGKKGSRARNKQARALRRQRAARGKKGFFSRMKGGGLKGLLNPKALLTSALISGGTGYAMDALGADEDSTTGKVINGVGDAAGTASNVMFMAQLARAVPWLGSLMGAGAGGGAAATAVGATGAAATGATAAAGTAAAAGGVSAGTALGTAAAGTAGTAAAVVGAPIWIPVAIGAAALAAAGTGIYFAHKQLKYGKLTPIRRFRYLQYGVEPGDAANNKLIYQLEELLMDHVGERNGGLEILGKSNSGGKDITMKDVYDLFDMDDGWFSNKAQQRMVFNVWYAQRFKPIFLTWVKNLRNIDPTKSILEADEDMEGAKQTKLVTAAWAISKSLYAIKAGPFEGTEAVTDLNAIEDAYNLAMKEAGKSEADKSKDKFKNRVKSVMNWVSPGSSLLMNYFDNQRDEEKAKADAADLTVKKIEENSGQKMLATTGAVTLTKGADSLLSTTLARTGKVSALQAIRYRAYGLKDLDTDRVRALAALETMVFNQVSISSAGNARLQTDGERLYYEAAGLFGQSAADPVARKRWAFWFGNRFWPICAAYMGAINRLAPSADMKQPEKTLKAAQLMEVAQDIMNAKSSEGESVWFYVASPWSAQEKLNTDSKIISGSMLVLKMQADKKVAVEEKLAGAAAAVNQKKGMLDNMMDSLKSGAQKASDWLLGKEGERNWLGKAVDGVSNTASSMWQGTKNAYSQASAGNYGQALGTIGNVAITPAMGVAGALGYGPGLSHPGKGTGGDINALPNVPSNAEIAGMKPAQRFAVLKPLFDAVAKMTGVDPNMLYAIASIESTFNPGAKAPTSSASGLFQFINGTWGNMIGKYGAKFGLSPNASPFDPKANALMGAMFLKDNFNFLKSRLSRGVNETDMYMAHFMGAGGAAKFLSADPKLNAVQSFPKEAKANPWIFYQMQKQGNRSVPNMSAPNTVGGVYQLMQQKVNKAQAVYGGRVQGSGTADLSKVSSSAIAATASGNPAAQASPSAVPSTTTTTLNAGGGVGAVQASKSPAVSASTGGTNMLATGGGYAGMLNAQATSAPSITSAGSLEAAAAANAAEEAKKAQLAERERQARQVQVRAAEVQTQLQQQTDQAQMSRVGEILQQSLDVQKQIAVNTQGTLDTLRELMRKGLSGASQEASNSRKPADNAPETRPAPQRPTDRRSTQVPVSMGFTNG